MAKEKQKKESKQDIEVKFDVPIPPIQRNGGRPTIYPWESLTKAGANFFVENVGCNTIKNAASGWAKRNGKNYKFLVRYVYIAPDDREFTDLNECKDHIKNSGLKNRIREGTHLWRKS